MARLSSVPQSSGQPEAQYGIGLTSFSQFINRFSYDGAERTDSEQLPLTVGDFVATQEGRKRYGPVMLKYIAERAIVASDIEQAGAISIQAQLAEGALRRLLDKRELKDDESTAGLTTQAKAQQERAIRQTFGEEARRLRVIAFARRASEPLIDAALVASQTFRDDDLRVLAEDSALALASIDAPVALPEPLDRIRPNDGIAPPRGVLA